MRVQELEAELAHRTAMISLNGDAKDVEDKIRTITAENVVLRAAADDAKKELLDSSKRVHFSFYISSTCHIYVIIIELIHRIR